MRKYPGTPALLVLLFLLIAVGVNVYGRKLSTERSSARNVVVQRIAAAMEQELAESGHDAEACVQTVFYARKSEWDALYGNANSPDSVRMIPLDSAAEQRISTAAGMQISCIYLDGKLYGIAEFCFENSVYDNMLWLSDLCIILCALVTAAYAFWISKTILAPFSRLAEYPERLSKGILTEKLPEKKNAFFGRYIWAMNMLADKLEGDREAIRRLSLEREQFITALIHGIKTPAASIKLLSEAISTGLYAPDGKINEKDAELAGRIEKNADEIEQLVTKVMESATNEIFDYEPHRDCFYRSRLESFLREEYTHRLKVSRTALHIENVGDLLIDSDYDGICRILRQVMDNAIKYGDGVDITVKMEKTDEGHFITVSNSGEPLPDSELPFVWGGFWRGSNAKNIRGSGVGLYESRLIARKLGGDIRMRAGEHCTDVTLFLPLSLS